MNHEAHVQHLLTKRKKLNLPDNLRVWMINSTKAGGGVAEMLPTMLDIFQRIGLDVRWEVITTDDFSFFELTKRLHNSIHGVGCDSYGPEDRKCHIGINVENHVRYFQQLIPEGDIVVVHDPQPMPLGNRFRHTNPTVWRCHIGLDHETPETRAAWNYLSQYAGDYQVGLFSLPEYIPACFQDRAEILSPAIDPASHKNRELTDQETADIFLSLGFDPTAPYFLQVSRWDKLKGWKELVETFNRAWIERRQVRDSGFRLVLAGPDPSAVADDPEGLECYEEIKALVDKYTSFHGTPIEMLSLDMTSREKNALMVNALQRDATVVVQNSSQEGFGLTVTEAMWKGKPVLGSTASGIRRQVQDGENGWICTRDWHLKNHIVNICSGEYNLEELGARAQETVEREFLVYKQIERYLEVFSQCLVPTSHPSI